MRRSRRSLIVVVVVSVCLAAYVPFVPARFGDFRAFYCAGRAVLNHADPYREHPLHECERAVAAPGVSTLRDDVTIPAPFPGYVLALFALLALLPFGLAAGVWLTGLIAALGLTVAIVARVAQVRTAVVAIAIGFPAVVTAVRLGQATPFVGLAMALTVYFLQRDKPRLAAIAALGIALEPHIAVATFGALFIAERRLRLPLFLGGLGLAMISIAVLGWAVNLEYLRAVLPAHALANIPDLTQFSASHFASIAGAGAERARSFGSAWYVCAALAGTVVALRLRPTYGVAALVFIPPAFEVFGGVYVHAAQLALATPALLLCVARATRHRSALFVALVFAVLPWLMIANFPMLVPAVAVLVIALAICMDAEHLAIPLALVTSLLMLGLFEASISSSSAHAPQPIVAYPAGNPLADVSWSSAMLVRDGYAPVAWYTAAKIPSLLAFALLLVGLAAAGRPAIPNHERPSARDRKVRTLVADT